MFYFSRRILRSSRGQLAVAVRRFAVEAKSDKAPVAFWFRQEGKAGFIFGAFGFLTGIAGLVVAYSAGKEVVDDTVIKLEQLDMIATKLEKAEVNATELTTVGTIIDRPGVEKVLENSMTSKPSKYYFVIYGDK